MRKKEGRDSPEAAKQQYEKMFIAAFEKNCECLENRFNQNWLECYEALLQVLILAAYRKIMTQSWKKFLDFLLKTAVYYWYWKLLQRDGTKLKETIVRSWKIFRAGFSVTGY